MWQSLDKRLTSLEEENNRLMKSVMKANYKSTQEKLVAKYIGFIFIEVVMILFMSLFFIFNPFINEKFRWAALIYWMVFFMIELALDLYLMLEIKSINIYEDPITLVARKAAQNWKIHKIGIIVGLPLAIGAVIMLSLAIDANEFVILGMIVGGLIGLIIGITQLLKFKNYYRLLQSN